LKEFAITTIDNPFNPFEKFNEWMLFDEEQGYNTCSYLARITKLKDNLTEIEINNEIERAIDVIIDNDFTNMYKKLSRNAKE